MKSRNPGLSDLLNYAHLVDDGIILNKDGALLITYRYQGPDIHSATPAELDTLAANFNRMALLLEDGWMLHVDELRIPSINYPEQGHFPTSVAVLIDEERRNFYEAEGEHYENLQFLTFVWKFPLPLVKTARHWFVAGLPKESGENLTSLLARFKDHVERLTGLLKTQLVLEQLNSADLLSYLNTCISGELMPIALPPRGCYLDVVLGRHPVIGGYIPKVGQNYVYALSVVGFLNRETLPGLLEELGTYPLVYRWSNRFIALSEATAEREIKRYEKHWHNKVKGFFGLVKEVFSGQATEKVNHDAKEMKDEATEALTLNSNKTTRFGFWTSTIMMMHEDIAQLEQAAKAIREYLEQRGFSCNQEDVNALDAWLGSVPGHGSCNMRRLFVHSINLAHLLPLHTIWAGATTSSPRSLLPANSPPVFYGATTGKTPFRFNLDVEDVGHQMVIGPPGAGKTTYLNVLTTQFFRYPDAQVFIFDKDYSHLGTTAALEGDYYDIGSAEEPLFCPLADLATESKKLRAKQFIEDLVTLQKINLTPDVLNAIHLAIELLADKRHENSRSLTVFQAQVQHESVRAALQYYTLKGQLKLLDATQDTLKTSHLQTFEMGWLLKQKPSVFLPVLRYIFDQIESRLEEANGKRPTLIILEEAWLYVSHPLFAEKLIDWLKTLRKKNARVVFASQSLADLYDPKEKTLTTVTAAILESCPTKIFLPNQQMEKEIRELYRMMGLNDRQIEILEHIGEPKRHYYVVTPEGRRLIDLGFSTVKPLALSFLGLNRDKSLPLLEAKAQKGSAWVYHYLVQQGFLEWAEYWKTHFYLDEEAT